MAQPLYFLPRVYRQQALSGERLSPSIMRERGIADVFADVRQGEFGFCELTRGPGGTSGTIVYYHTPEGKIPNLTQYAPDKQEWTEAIAGDAGLWIGLNVDEPVTPEDLRRHKVHSGYRLDIVDGEQLTIPIIRRPDDSSELPRDMYWEKGTPVQSVQKAYRKYWDASAEVLNWFVPDIEAIRKVDQWKALTLAIDVVGINYRYGANEHNLLRWIDAQNYLQVLSWSIDYPGYASLQEAEKKSASSAVEANSTHGREDDTQDIEQAGESFTQPL